MIVMPAIDNVAITKENMISPHRDRIVDRDGHARYANTMLDYLLPVLYIYSNVLIAPCSTADPGIAGSVLIQNKIRNKSNTKIMPVFSLKMAQKLPVCDQFFFFFVKLSVCKNFLWFFSDFFDRFWRILSLRPFLG